MRLFGSNGCDTTDSDERHSIERVESKSEECVTFTWCLVVLLSKQSHSTAFARYNKTRDKARIAKHACAKTKTQNPNDVIKMYRTRDSIVRSNF